MEGFKRIAIPAMGVGTYRWPVELATPIAIRMAMDFEATHNDVLIRFVCFSEDISSVYRHLLATQV